MQPALRATYLPDISYRDRVFHLERLMKAMDVPKLAPPVSHEFLPGFYARSVTMPEGMLGVGKVHRKPHRLIVVYGTLTIADEQGVLTVTGPCSFDCPAQTKRTLFAQTEVLLRTEHTVSAQTFDLAAIEAELVADSYEDSMKE